MLNKIASKTSEDYKKTDYFSEIETNPFAK